MVSLPKLKPAIPLPFLRKGGYSMSLYSKKSIFSTAYTYFINYE